MRIAVRAVRAALYGGFKLSENENEIPRFGNLVVNKVLDGDKVRIDDILNKEIIICGFQTKPSKYKDKGCGYCTKIQFYFYNDESKTKRVFFSGSGVIKDQMEEAKNTLEKGGLPLLFKAMVKKVGNYYSLV